MDVSAASSAFVYGNVRKSDATAPYPEKVINSGSAVNHERARRVGSVDAETENRKQRAVAEQSPTQAAKDDRTAKRVTPLTREIEVNATELRPLVITPYQPKATRAFLEVATERRDVKLIDIYV